MNKDQTFQIACVLAAISVPLLAVVADADYLANNIFIKRVVAITGNLFLFAAIISYAELIFRSATQGNSFIETIRQLSITRLLILFGLASLSVFQMAQNQLLFQL